MVFRRGKKTVKKSMGGIEKLITWVIIGWAAASIFWLSRTKKWKKITRKCAEAWEKTAKKCISGFGKFTVSCLKFFSKK